MYECVFIEPDMLWKVYQDGVLIRIIHGYRNIVEWMDWMENVSPEQPVFHVTKGDEQ